MEKSSIHDEKKKISSCRQNPYARRELSDSRSSQFASWAEMMEVFSPFVQLRHRAETSTFDIDDDDCRMQGETSNDILC